MRQRLLTSMLPLPQLKDSLFSLSHSGPLLPKHCRKKTEKPTDQPYNRPTTPAPPGPLCCNPFILLLMPPRYTLQSPFLDLLLTVTPSAPCPLDRWPCRLVGLMGWAGMTSCALWHCASLPTHTSAQLLVFSSLCLKERGFLLLKNQPRPFPLPQETQSLTYPLSAFKTNNKNTTFVWSSS